MDALVARFDSIADGDLTICPARGVAYQRGMAVSANYGDAYFARYQSYEGTEIARQINAGRVALVDEHVGAGSPVVDIGVGSGEFIRARPGTMGQDINPAAIDWLRRKNLWVEKMSEFSAFTFWDVLEHVPEPDRYFRKIPDRAHLFCCLPIFAELGRIRESRHYKPGEHLYYWTERGFVDWMAEYRFGLLERRDFEIAAGRDSIVSFAFRRNLPGYRDTVAQYAEMHGRAYGASATELWLDLVAAEVVKINPASIIDYGCGRSDLLAHFWADGRRRLARYDPAIPAFKEKPAGRYDLAICCDVMEHIRLEDVDRVLGEIKALADRVLFTISLRPARARLPDGRNAHVTLLTAGEWSRWISSIFGRAVRIPTGHGHLLMLKTYR